jgi:hypothetical protein
MLSIFRPRQSAVSALMMSALGIIVTEANRFTWPGPDLRPAVVGDPASVALGLLPQALFEQVRAKWLALFAAHQTYAVARTE